jgi:hypothetical protein
MPNLKLITMKIKIMPMVAMERKTIIVTIANKQLHFTSSKKNVNKMDFHYLLSPVNRVLFWL